MSQTIKKFIGNNQVGSDQIRIENQNYLRSRNSDDNADVNILRVNADELVELSTTMVPESISVDVGAYDKEFARMYSNELNTASGQLAINVESSATPGTGILLLSADSEQTRIVSFNGSIAPSLQITGSNQTNYVALKAPNGQSSNVTFQLPGADGTSGQVIQTNGSGVLSFVTPSVPEVKFKTARAATTANITIATALNSGDILDGVTLADGDIVLVKNQSAPAENGAYVVGPTPARADFADTFNKHVGLVVLVSEGTANADLAFVFTSDAGGTLGTTALTVAPFPTNAVQVPVWEKQTFTLAGGDITNQYVDLANVAETDSIDLFVRGGGIMEEGQSYTVSYTGGAGGNTRITFAGILATAGASALVAGDVLVVKYQYMA